MKNPFTKLSVITKFMSLKEKAQYIKLMRQVAKDIQKSTSK